VFRRLANIYDRILLRITLIVYYYLPIIAAYINPFQRKSNILETHRGSVAFDSGKYAVYVLWQPRTIPWYVVNMLEGLKDHQVNAIVVSNHKLTPEQRATLQSLSAEVLVRGNKGLDFGAYKDAVLYITNRERVISRLLLLNDSVYVFRRGLNQLLEALLSDQYEVVSAYENWELHYHFQSFCIGLAGNVVYNPIVQRFWRKYRPISIRRWCIDLGEVRFSAALREASANFMIVFGINDLLTEISKKADLPTLLQYREFVPAPIRGHNPPDDVMSTLQESQVARQAVVMRRFRDSLSSLFALRAQAHTGAFFFPKFLKSPFLKRDIVYRELFSIYEVERMLFELGFKAERQTILDEIRRRGTAAHLKRFAKRRYRLGLL
jgi:hypothetical protein